MQPPLTAAAAPPRPACILDIRPHPLTDEGRGVGLVRLPEGGSVADLVAAALQVERAELPALAPAIEATLDGRRIAGDAWATTALATPGEPRTLALRLATRGGDDSDPLQTVLQVALIVAAAAVSTTLGGVPGALAAAAILIGGNLVLNSVFRPDLPPDPELAEPTPQYTLSGGANRARPWAPLPLVLGAHRLFPDLAAREYTEFRDGEQFLYQTFSFGVGDLDIGARRLGDTPLDDYDGVRQSLARPGTALANFVAAVATVAGGKLEHVPHGTPSGDSAWNTIWVQRRSADDATRLALDLVASLFGASNSGDLTTHTIAVRIQWRTVTDDDSAAWTTRDITLSHSSRDQLRRTESIAVARGQYDVRLRSNNSGLDANSRAVQDITWTALRSYRAVDEDRDADTRLGVEIRASGQLSGRLERLSAIVRQRVPTWTGSAWSADTSAGRRASSNPAALFRAFARGWRAPPAAGETQGRLLAGSGRRDDAIDDPLLGRWHEWCEAEDLRCDIVVDGRRSPEEVEALIARRGRAAPSWATGKLGVVWEDPRAPVASSITPARVLAGSASIQWASGEVAEEIVARYIDADAGWERSEIRRTMPGVDGAPAYTATVDLAGTTRRDQARREVNLQAARQIYRRRRIAWAMGRDGATVSRGDVVFLSHDLVSGGVTGRLDADATGQTAAAPRLDRPVAIAAGSHLLFEAPDGTLHQTAVSGADGSDTDAPALSDPLPADPASRVEGAGPEDWTWRLYSAAVPPLRVRIVEVSPRAEDRFEIVAIDESARYHDAADLAEDEAWPAIPAWDGPRILSATVSETLLRVGAGWAVEIELVVTVAGDWRGGAVLASHDGGPRRRVARFDPGDDSATWIVPPTGTLDITILPGSAVAPTGPAHALRHEIGGVLTPPGAPANFLIDALPDGTRRFRWTPPPDIDLAGVEIRYREDREAAWPWDDMLPLHRGLLAASPWETFEPPAGRWVFALRAVDTGGRTSPDTRIVATLPSQRGGKSIVFRTPSAEGWQIGRGGAIVGVRSDDLRDAVEAAANYTWADLATDGTTWANWETWATGSGDDAHPAVSFTSPIIDLRVAIAWSVAQSSAAVGAVTVRFRGGASEAACRAAAWLTVGASGTPATVTYRYAQISIEARAGASAVSSLDHLAWWLPANISERKYLDLTAARIRRDWVWNAAQKAWFVPLNDPRGDLRIVTDVIVALQSVPAGATWQIVSKRVAGVRGTGIRFTRPPGAGETGWQDFVPASCDIVLRGIE